MTTAITVRSAAATLMVVVVGAVFLLCGLGGALYQLEHPPIQKSLIYVFVGLAVLGALLMPSVFDVLFPRVQKLYILVFPNGLPLLGGRRSGDPQP